MGSIRSELSALIDSENRSRNSFSVGLFYILFTLLLSVCVAIMAEHLSNSFPTFELVFEIMAVFFIGTRWRAFGNIIHECSHRIFVEKPWQNDFIGHLLASFEFSDFNVYCQHHQTHHSHLGDPDHDFDFKERLIYLSDPTPSKRRLVTTALSAVALVPLWIRQAKPVLWSANSPLWVNLLRVFILIALLYGLTQHQSAPVLFVYIVLPYATTYQWVRLFSDCADHIFLYSRENEVDRSRNHILRPLWLNSLLFPRNDAYHLVHHLFPTLPTRHYPKAHDKFLKNSWYAKKNHFIQLPWQEPTNAMELEVHGQSK